MNRFMQYNTFCVSIIFSFVTICFAYGNECDTSVQNHTSQDILYKAVMDALKDSLHRADSNSVHPDIGEIDALIINETRSRQGQEFYEIFYLLWEPPRTIDDYIITVSEKKISNNKTVIAIEVNESSVVSFFLPPRLEEINDWAVQSVEKVQTFLQEIEFKERLLDEEMQGDGI